MQMPRNMKQDQIYELIKSNLPVGFSIVDKKGKVVDFNRAAEMITGYAKDEIIGKSHIEILHGTHDKESCPLFQQTLQRQEETVATESVIRKKNGDRIIISVTTFPLIDNNGILFGGVELFRDITEIKRLEREQKNILSMFAHDMKNPVLTSGGFIARLLAGKGGKLTKKQQSYLEQINNELHTVENLILGFLEFSRLKAKEYLPKKEPVNIGTAISKLIERVKIEADKKNITVFFDAPPNQAETIQADPLMIDRLITNLLVNAIKYTEAQGTIKVTLRSRDKDILVQVADTGMGIPADQLPYIFDAFVRVSRDSKGSGLGLAIVKTIIEAHGGSVWVESILGKGSTFSFTIPK